MVKGCRNCSVQNKDICKKCKSGTEFFSEWRPIEEGRTEWDDLKKFSNIDLATFITDVHISFVQKFAETNEMGAYPYFGRYRDEAVEKLKFQFEISEDDTTSPILDEVRTYNVEDFTHFFYETQVMLMKEFFFEKYKEDVPLEVCQRYIPEETLLMAFKRPSRSMEELEETVEKAKRKEESEKRFTNYDLVMSYSLRDFASCFAGFHVSMLKHYTEALGVPLLEDMDGYTVAAVNGFEEMFAGTGPTTGFSMFEIIHKISKESFAGFFIEAQLQQVQIFFRNIYGIGVGIDDETKLMHTMGYLQWLNLPAQV